jgi:Mn-dependent DtxR family transcriptional regulator
LPLITFFSEKITFKDDLARILARNTEGALEKETVRRLLMFRKLETMNR